MERNYRKLWWQHWLAIVCFSVVPLLFVNLSLYKLFDRIYTDKVTETLRNTAENRRDAIDLFFSERIAQLYTVANTNTFENLTDETYKQVGIDAPIQTGSWNAFLGAPRTYGMTLRLRY